MKKSTEIVINECIDGFLTARGEALTTCSQSRTPDLSCVKELLELSKKIVYSRFFANSAFDADEFSSCVKELYSLTEEAVYSVFCYRCDKSNGCGDEEKCRQKASEIAEKFISSLKDVYELVKLDVEATLNGDPAALSPDIIILCYPGVEAVFTYRLAHVLYTVGVPLIPRMMTEIAHSKTGIDIHPGANIGKSFVIDHGTGVVIGETTVIGDRVKLYQGVTLGAKSLADARSLVGVKRHPTVEDDVTIYSGATILGGKTVIGKGAVIGSSVFITASVPANVTVAAEKPKLRLYENDPID